LKAKPEVRTTLSNATLQQHLTVIRLFYDYLVEERVCARHPLRPPIGGRSLIQRHRRLPWIPSDEQWQTILQACKQEPLRNRVMLAMSYDAALRREEVCSLETTDVDPAHRLLRIRSEATKSRRERVVPYSAPTGEIFGQYLRVRRELSRERGRLFLSESCRNLGQPISLWGWSKAYRFYRHGRTMDFGPTLDRLVRPLNDVFDYTGIKTQLRRYVLLFFLREMAERNNSFWGWTTEEWIEEIGARRTSRQHVVAVAYLLCDFRDLHRVKSDHIVYNCLARKVFGREYVHVITVRVQGLLSEWDTTTTAYSR
jgi:hypothetical protein